MTSIFNNLDDLGQEDGRVQIPFAEEAREHVLILPVEAVGKRPRDYAQRDLLVGGWQRDGRCIRFRHLIKNKDPRFFQDTSRLTKADRETCARARAFQVMHTAALLRFSNDLEKDDPCQKVLLSLRRCPPTLYQVDSEALTRMGLRTCKRSRLCPYCLSRKALELDSLLRNDYDVGARKCLALLSLTAPVNDLTARNGMRDAYKKVVSEAQAELSNIAREHLGLNGGLFVADAGPLLFENDRWWEGELVIEKCEGLELHASILGEVPVGRSLGLIRKHSEKDLLQPIRIGKTEVKLRLTIRYCTERDALRSLLFGEAPSMYRGEDVVAGAFRFPPWHLASHEQWTQHVLATKDLSLYRFWGDWKDRYSKNTKQQSTPFVNASHRRGRYKSRTNLKHANQDRNHEKEQALDELLPVVRPIWEHLLKERGRTPGRSLLQQHAKEKGIILSERQARGIVRRLASE